MASSSRKSINEPERTFFFYYRLARHKLHMAWRHFRLAANWYDSGLGDSAWMLYGLVRTLKPAVCVEIGSARGKSTCHIALALKENLHGKLWAVDPHGPTQWNDAGEVSTRLALQRNLRQIGAEAYVEIVQADSSAAARDWTAPIDLIFFDGDHSYEGVKRDWELFSPHLSPFGIAVFHDSAWEINNYDFAPRSDLGVPRFLEELRRAGYPLITSRNNYGITQIQSPRGGLPLTKAAVS